MTRIPVAQTIAGAYRFGASRFLSILGAAWLPYVLMIVVSIVAFEWIEPGLSRVAATGGAPGTIDGRTLAGVALIVAVVLLASAMIAVSVMRMALGQHPRPVFVFFSLGAAVWRMLVATIVAAVIVVIARLGIAAIAAFIVARLPEILPAALVVWAGWLAWTASTIALLYVAARILFLLPAVVVAESAIGLARAWHLSLHNFWRIVLVGLAAFLPVPVLFVLASSLVSTGSIAAALDFDTLNRSIWLYLARLHPVGISGIVLQIVYTIVMLGLSNGASATAYRSLVRLQPQTPFPAAAKEGPNP